MRQATKPLLLFTGFFPSVKERIDMNFVNFLGIVAGAACQGA